MPQQQFYSNVPIAQGNQLYLERPRINSILEQAVQRPVVSVTAGAGYGKTHAVYSFLHNCDFVTAWIQLSDRDNIGGRFWENFTRAVSMLSQESARLLAETGFPETERQFERYLAIPRDEIIPESKYIFVYDDFHLIHDKKVLRFLEHSITTPFSNITSILISRLEPALVQNPKTTAMLAKITEEDLRFTQAEMLNYFMMQDIKPSPHTASTVYRDTGGWAFAIHLSALSLKNTAAYIPAVIRSNIFKLIESEVMAGLSPAVRKYLIKVSLIEHLTPALLREIDPDLDPADGLGKIGSFVQFDTYLNAWRVHPLFLEYLSGRQDELTAAEKTTVYTRAAAWCAENNQKIDAINYAEKAGDYDKLLDVTYTFPRVMPNHIAALLLAIYERAPRKLFCQNPVTHVLYTRLLMAVGLFDRARDELTAIIPKLEALPRSPLVCRALAGCYNNRGLIGMITSTYTGDYDYIPYFERASYYHSFSNYDPAPPLSVMSVGSYICRVSNNEPGEMERYIDAISAMVPYAAASMGGCGYGMDDLAKAELAFFREDLNRAEHSAREALRKARERNQYEIENRALFFLLRISVSKGGINTIQDIFKQLEAQLSIVGYPNRKTYYDIVCGWFYTQTGAVEKLAPWLKNDFEDSDLNSINHGPEILVKAKYHFAEKRCPAALAALEGRNSKYGAWAFVTGKVEMKTLEAVCRYQARDRAGAFRALEEAYTLAQPNALYMPFTELGKDMRTLAGAALKNAGIAIPQNRLETIQRNASAYAKKLFSVAERYRSPEPNQTSSLKNGQPAHVLEAPGTLGTPGVPLSRRELTVLSGLSQGLTRAEIAENEKLSINTVKSAIKSVYNKIGALNQADAVRIAAVMGLIK